MKCKYPDCVFDALSGKDLCIFHAPVDEKYKDEAAFRGAIQREVIEKHNYKCNGFVFPFPVDFAQEFDRPVDFKDAVFHKHADFANAAFESEVSFENTRFLEGAIFSGARFISRTSFDRSKFDGRCGSNDSKMLCADFRKAIFRGDISFRATGFNGGTVDFSGAKAAGGIVFAATSFTGKAIFEHVEFSSGHAWFRECRFRGDSSFWYAKFMGEITDFSESQFIASADFQNCTFDKGQARFKGTSFNGEVADFYGSSFSGDVFFRNAVFGSKQVRFTNAKFLGGETDFTDAVFACESAFFNKAKFAHDVLFIRNKISSIMDFSEITFEAGATFHFRTPIFDRKTLLNANIVFYRVRFNPFLTHFMDIRTDASKLASRIVDMPAMVFRFCELKDVYFADNDMSLFSFFQCVFFEESFFVGCTWGWTREKILGCGPFLRFKRAFQINEDLRFSQKKSLALIESDGKFPSIGGPIRFPDNYSDIAEIYLRMKSASDRAKDYQRASWFYFNEFEMKRLDNKTKKTTEPQKQGGGRSYGKFLLYSAYKLFAGYGEKPLWSFLWFLVLTVGFSILHLFNGFNGPNGIVINYDLALNLPNIPTLFVNLLRAIVYTLYKIVPISYLPIQRTDIIGALPTTGDQVLIILNFVVLGTLLVLTGIGLKRHFRRF
ncbi:MAG: pentapeptide repeat-containing protein [candidate division Zixibacteria bacterium]|nr:pentapeptide repeat-containing protein [candidate division Zixibacteria bacterium]